MGVSLFARRDRCAARPGAARRAFARTRGSAAQAVRDSPCPDARAIRPCIACRDTPTGRARLNPIVVFGASVVINSHQLTVHALRAHRTHSDQSNSIHPQAGPHIRRADPTVGVSCDPARGYIATSNTWMYCARARAGRPDARKAIYPRAGARRPTEVRNPAIPQPSFQTGERLFAATSVKTRLFARAITSPSTMAG